MAEQDNGPTGERESHLVSELLANTIVVLMLGKYPGCTAWVERRDTGFFHYVWVLHFANHDCPTVTIQQLADFEKHVCHVLYTYLGPDMFPRTAVEE